MLGELLLGLTTMVGNGNEPNIAQKVQKILQNYETKIINLSEDALKKTKIDPEEYLFSATQTTPKDTTHILKPETNLEKYKNQKIIIYDENELIEKNANKIYEKVYEKKSQTKDQKNLITIINKTIQTHPNPFNNQTSIKIQMPYKSTIEKAEIYDLIGQKILELEPQKEALTHTYQINLNATSGIYIFRTQGTYTENKQTKEFYGTAKLQLIK
ncbi:hypothetical protein K9L97_05450 [Candidatus Woesearchaeota archaeon]|nr:hypothetical protein [Candidatus Woesearchaeota archaeon]